jgi:formate/nitrite transporter FocA (FNT family)
MFGALIFPFGLVVIVMTGADLCTGSFMYTTLACLHRRTSVLLMLRHWFLTFFGNLAGALFVSCVIIGYGGVFSGAAYKKELLAIATTKAVTPMWHQIFLKAIGANWLVCLACFLACCAREFFSKVCKYNGCLLHFLDHKLTLQSSKALSGGPFLPSYCSDWITLLPICSTSPWL